MGEMGKNKPSESGRHDRDIINVLEMMADDVRYIDSFPVERWLVRQEHEEPEWVKAWQTIYREALLTAIDILKDRA